MNCDIDTALVVQLSACFSKGDDVLEDGFAAGAGACSGLSGDPFVPGLV